MPHSVELDTAPLLSKPSASHTEGNPPAPDIETLLSPPTYLGVVHETEYREASSAYCLYYQSVAKRQYAIDRLAASLLAQSQAEGANPNSVSCIDSITELQEDLERWNNLVELTHSIIASSFDKNRQVQYVRGVFMSRKSPAWYKLNCQNGSLNDNNYAIGLSGAGAALTLSLICSSARGNMTLMAWSFSLYCCATLLTSTSKIAFMATSMGPTIRYSFAFPIYAVAQNFFLAATILLAITVATLDDTLSLDHVKARRSMAVIIPCACVSLGMYIWYNIEGMVAVSRMPEPTTTPEA